MEQISFPTWLAGDEFSFDISKILKDSCYYPYGDMQGAPVKQFMKGRNVYSYVFVDYHVDKGTLLKEIEEHGFLGYRVIYEQDIPESLLTPNGLVRLIHPEPGDDYVPKVVESFCKWFIFENESAKLRFSFLFLSADAIAAYQALYFSNKVQPRFLVFDYPRGINRPLQDHWRALMKKNGFFERVLSSRPAYAPKYISFDEDGFYWPSYSRYVEDIYVNFHIFERTD